jgi:hypothetical protein
MPFSSSTRASARRTTLIVVLVCLVAASAAAPTADARLRVGVSEQNAQMFASHYFKRLHVRYARVVVPWNVAARHDYWPGYLRSWLRGARRRHVQPLVAFNVANFATKHRGRGPSPKRFRALFKRFRRKYRDVHVFTPWNEVNHSFQPTYRDPRLAYRYYRVVKGGCRHCTVLAADVLDDSTMVHWLRRYRHYFKGRGIWGIHNYGDANHHRSLRHSATLRITRLVRGPIWSTEAGGIVGFKTAKGRVAYHYSLRRQKRAQRYLFGLMRSREVRRRYRRVYIYNWTGTWARRGRVKHNRWDSGLMSVGGKPRPAYWDLLRQIRRLR